MTVYAITDTKKGRTGIAPTYLQTTPATVCRRDILSTHTAWSWYSAGDCTGKMVLAHECLVILVNIIEWRRLPGTRRKCSQNQVEIT